MIQYKCKVCGTDMESPEELVGSWEPCPSCGAGVTVPGLPAGPQHPPLLRDWQQADQSEGPDSAAPLPGRERSAEAGAKRKKGWGNIITGVVLIVMGLSGLFGGSIFTGDADVIDMLFDVLGIGMIIWGSVQLAGARAARAKAAK